MNISLVILRENANMGKTVPSLNFYDGSAVSPNKQLDLHI